MIRHILLTIYRANTSLESVKVDGTEEIGNVKKEVINGSTADVYEATVTTDKADLYVKAVSDSALVNVSANGTKSRRHRKQYMDNKRIRD